MAHTRDEHDERTLVLVLPLAEATLLMEQPLATAVGLGEAFLLCGCDHCTENLTNDLGMVAHLCSSTRC
jgi:hypothetical protein